MSDDVEISIKLPRQTVDKIRAMAEANRMSAGKVITESVLINERIRLAERDRARILLKNRDGTMTEIVRHPS